MFFSDVFHYHFRKDLLVVSRLFTSSLSNKTVAIKSVPEYITSTYGFEAPLDGKCVEDAREVDFNFDE